MKLLKNEKLILYIPLLILTIISLFNMVNAKLVSSIYNNIFIKQIIWFSLGYLIIYIIQKLKMKNIFRYSKYGYFISLFLLILVLLVGESTNGARCWLNFKWFSFQPSEFTKLTLALYLIDVASKKKLNSLKDEFLLLLKLLFITLLPSILVFLEPDTGAIINFFLILLIVIFSLKLNKIWYIIFFSLITLFLGTFLILYFKYQDILIKLIGTSFFYRMDRIINFASGNSYQLSQALITIGSSSFLGVGLNKIILYIPEAPTDFIFAFSIGNFGILSAILILLSLFIIDFYLLFKINTTNNKKGKMFAYSYLGMFLFHQIYNIGMNLGLLPIMGIPLPFLSYGGTNTIINFIFLGITIHFLDNKKEFNFYY